jgi:hypothetical protein
MVLLSAGIVSQRDKFMVVVAAHVQEDFRMPSCFMSFDDLIRYTRPNLAK